MPSSKNPKVQLIDQDGEHIADNDGRLKVDIAGATINAGDIDVDVSLDASTDSITVMGSDDGGTTKRVLKTDADGNVQVDIVSGGGGGGTEYTEGDADGTITGPAIMWEDTTNILRAVSAAKPLPVSASVSTAPPDTILSGKKGFGAGSANRIRQGDTPQSYPCKYIDIIADITNVGIVYIGDSDIESDGEEGGIPLYAGDTYTLNIANAEDAWAIGSTSQQKIYFNILT